MKTPGQVAYEEDVRRKPNYPGGPSRRVTWDQLDYSAKLSWERDPTPREYEPHADS